MQTDTTDMTCIYNAESQLNWDELHWSERLPHDGVETTTMQFDSNLPQYWPEGPSQPSSASTGQSPKSPSTAKQPQTPRGRRKLSQSRDPFQERRRAQNRTNQQAYRDRTRQLTEGLRQDLEQSVQYNQLLSTTVHDMLSMMKSMKQNVERVLAVQPKLSSFDFLSPDSLTPQNSRVRSGDSEKN